MTEKIEWYKEVLELEPNSKVFFPLARLLVDDGQDEEARKILERGLERHPEFLEARLFLIELLYKGREDAECEAQVEKLSKMFSSYAGFWQAWAACLSRARGEEDTATILRFLAAQFVSGPLHLHDVLDRGLQSLLAEHDQRLREPAPEIGATPLLENNEQTGGGPAVLESSVLGEAEEVPPDMPEDSGPGEILPEMLADAPPAQEIPEMARSEPESLFEKDAGEEAGLPEQPDNSAELPVIEENAPEMMAEAPLTESMEEALDEAAPEAAEPEAKDLPVVEEMECELPPDSIFEEMTESLSQGAVIDNNLQMPERAGRLETAPVAEDIQIEPGTSSGMTNSPLVENEPELPEAADDLADLPVSAPEDLPIPEESAAPEPEAQAGPAAGGEAAIEPLAEPDLPEGAEDLADLPLREVEGQPGHEEKPAASMAAKAGEENAEPFSLRTRSMAEVLAEQGDIQGALDIYHELAAAARDTDEAEDIRRRIATLEGRLGSANEPAEPAKEATGTQGKEKLIGMLETLARRVEARARS